MRRIPGWLWAILGLGLSVPVLPATAEVSALVQLTPARVMPLAEHLRAYGTVEFAPEGGRTLSLEAESLVSQVLVANGQRVHQGEALLRVAPSINDQLQLQQAQIGVRFALTDQQRLESLRTRQLATNAEVQTAQQTLAKAQATLHDLQMRLKALQAGVVRSPIDGVVETVSVHQGDLIAAGQPLLRLSTGSALRILLGVEPEDLPRVKVGDAVRLRPVYGDQFPLSGKIQQIYWQVDPKTRLAQVVVPMAATASLLPGAMVRAQIILGHQKSLAIPDSAVLQQGGRSYCFVDVHGKAQQRWIETGWREAGWIAVSKGLQAGEMVVSLGNYELRDGMALRVAGKS
ncbi:MAG: efflux RND transporter periplasmic adaptor subunit [Gammaproteobacteria bacterium]|nr:efflux RND transporter periplasmic adaptor subunit [Gammaproteobacteria bacterium]